jgi:DNA-binding protein HU-beta
MKKSDLIDNVAAVTGQTKVQAKVSVEAVLSEIKNGVLSNGSAQFVGFGSFKVVARKERIGRNPQTGEAITITAKNVVKFKPSF